MTLMLSENVIDRREKHFPTTPIHGGAPGILAGTSRWGCDPLEPDASDDETLTTSPRRLLRLAIAAADVGARFNREGLQHDPAAWMMAPRALFGGIAGMDACQELSHFNRSIILHGLNLGLDADPDAVDALLQDEDYEYDVDYDDDRHGHDGRDGAGTEVEATDGRSDQPAGSGFEPSNAEPDRPQLLTCWIDFVEAPSRVFAFCAMVTARPADIVERVVGRFGAAAAAGASFSTGYDNSTLFASAMISDAMAVTLTLAGEAPDSPLARGLDVLVEQRFVDCSMAA